MTESCKRKGRYCDSEGPVADGAFGGSIPVCGKKAQEGTGTEECEAGTGMDDRDFR